MKREEAIKLIDTHTVCFYNEIDSPTLQALHLAIEALKADVVRWSSWNKTFEQSEIVDLISRADAIAYIERVINSGLGRNKSLDYIHKYISALPSADRPHGEWKVDEKHTEELYTHPVVCSECGQDVVIEWGKFTPYCPNCGAYMRGGDSK